MSSVTNVLKYYILIQITSKNYALVQDKSYLICISVHNINKQQGAKSK